MYSYTYQDLNIDFTPTALSTEEIQCSFWSMASHCLAPILQQNRELLRIIFWFVSHVTITTILKITTKGSMRARWVVLKSFCEQTVVTVWVRGTLCGGLLGALAVLFLPSTHIVFPSTHLTRRWADAASPKTLSSFRECGGGERAGAQFLASWLRGTRRGRVARRARENARSWLSLS